MTALFALLAFASASAAGHFGEKIARTIGSQRTTYLVLATVSTAIATPLAILFTIRMDWWAGDVMIGIFFNLKLVFAVACVGAALLAALNAYACARKIDEQEKRYNDAYSRLRAQSAR